ncbi:CRISPR-associated protein, Cmr3 family [Tindallia magadiensis]|uniref:CRISPR-associated protein, Cmr3 family n=1 Tax=Tindallia magadiensis TaxID=69895 RepID=A0A1I3ENI0_9FIRM|nr:type III-B CRISPR module-associated protein Cmr3 [Tindallia magadiensis]SFI00547.1 CRISPR-associated protein, Cmr3 family [Tindallia magadiensis]
MLIRIKAIDTVFFRDGKPFNMGSENVADGIFPPLPSAIYGALRSAYFGQRPELLHDLIKDGSLNSVEDPSANLKINGIVLVIKNTLCIPAPLDLVFEKEKSINLRKKEKRNKSYQAVCLKPTTNDSMKSSVPTEYILSYNKMIQSIADGFISDMNLSNYINEDCEQLKVSLLSDYVSSEARIGIARDYDTRSAKESMLYLINMNRTNDVSLLVDFEGIDIPEKGILKLGGEGKATVYKKTSDKFYLEQPEIDGDYFKICLITPAVFENGWLPDFIDKINLTGYIGNTKVKVLSAATGKPLAVGGYDQNLNQPKPMKRAVPAGSVYYMKIEEGTKEEVIKCFHNRSIMENKLGKEGFGLSYIAKWGGDFEELKE